MSGRAIQFVAAVLSVILTLLPAVSAVPAGAAHYPKLGKYHIAIGDSFGLGYIASDLPVDAQCRHPGTPSFVCLLYRYLLRLNPNLALHNFSQVGVDSCSLAHGHACGDAARTSSQLDDAVAFLRGHPGEVSPISLTIGDDEIGDLALESVSDPANLPQNLLPRLGNFRSNLDTVLARLRAVSPDAEILVATLPDGLSTLDPLRVPPATAQSLESTLHGFNAIVADETPKYGATVGDAANAIDAHPAGASALFHGPDSAPGPNHVSVNIHPSAEGYRVIGRRLIADSGYTVPLALRVGVRRRTVPVRGSNAVVGTTSPFATVTVSLILPHSRVRNLHRTADYAGAFVARFAVGRDAGRASALVCASDSNGYTMCKPTIDFSITARAFFAST
ncbi:MAG: hypothetical protein NVS2B16_00370 [Chloroflexota bacterium]